MATKQTVVKLAMEKDTKNTVRFSEIHDDTEHPVIRTLYISKPEHAKLGAPTSITVTIEAGS